jgi:hypothetical protein
MNAEAVESKRKGVTCLHCGVLIALPSDSAAKAAEQHGGSAVPTRTENSSYVVLWCSACHKEAPYLSQEFVDLDAFPAEASSPNFSGSVPRTHGLVMRRGQAA